MSLVGTRVALPHRCSIERDAATTDAWGGSGTPDWQAHLPALPCHAWVTGGREMVSSDRTVVVVDKRMIVPLGTDVTERDRVASVTDRGESFFDGPLNIEAVLRQRDHLELALVEVS